MALKKEARLAHLEAHALVHVSDKELSCAEALFSKRRFAMQQPGTGNLPGYFVFVAGKGREPLVALAGLWPHNAFFANRFI
jgi:hypothetical protein